MTGIDADGAVAVPVPPSPPRRWGRIASYVVAGEASLESHAAVVKAEEEAEAQRQADAAKNSSAGGSGVCTRYVSTWYGGSRLILAPCR